MGCRTMSLVRSQSAGQNFFMVIVRFLETFVGSMSAGLLLSYAFLSLYLYVNMHGLSWTLLNILLTSLSNLRKLIYEYQTKFDLSSISTFPMSLYFPICVLCGLLKRQMCVSAGVGVGFISALISFFGFSFL